MEICGIFVSTYSFGYVSMVGPLETVLVLDSSICRFLCLKRSSTNSQFPFTRESIINQIRFFKFIYDASEGEVVNTSA